MEFQVQAAGRTEAALYHARKKINPVPVIAREWFLRDSARENVRGRRGFGGLGDELRVETMPKTVSFRHFLRDIFKVSVITFFTRALGFAREFFVAAFIGVGPVADAFALALRAQILFRQSLVERALPIAFVPRHSEAEAISEEAAEAFRQKSVDAMAALAMLTSVFLLVGTPLIVHLLAPGFIGEPARVYRAYFLVAAVTAAIQFYMLGGMLLAFLQAKKKFIDSNLTLMVMNVVIVLAVLLTAVEDCWVPLGFIDTTGILALGLFGAGLIQLTVAILLTRRAGLFPKPQIKGLGLIPAFRLLGTIAPVSLVSFSLTGPILLATRFVSDVEGAVAILFYAERFVLIAPYFVGFAIANVLLPNLSGLIAQGAIAEARRLLIRTLFMAGGLGLVLWAGLIVAGHPALSLVFSRTQLGQDGVDAVWHALLWLSPLVPIRFCLQPVMQFVFARKAMRVAFAAGFGGTLVTAIAFFALRSLLPDIIATACAAVVIGQFFQLLLPFLWMVADRGETDNGDTDHAMERESL
ncbi:murein biosynthesis integral membrane protein MurJ [Parvularcula marina]|uniref:Lipid II flippase MurJ n=1 Tax=Parvularcula marina TaxID=2292771 RepID=A0A371RL08_9PROT|nr:lipid II flippase MurJ [Parvularcula marina]RFB06152.1 hypothetical protein DX908_13275 [Parvularcula marina]